MKCLVTIDTEWDRRPEKSGNITLENLAALPRFHSLFVQEGVRPCYFCSYEVAVSKDFFEFGRQIVKNNEGEIGSHLHPWSNPPYIHDEVTVRQRTPFPTEYPDDVFAEKLILLRDELENRFGTQRSYRAGRYGFSESHAPLLMDAGYFVDSSITPFTSWQRTNGWSPNAGPDFMDFDEYPFFFKSGTTEKHLLELPVTVSLPHNQLLTRVYRSGLMFRRILHQTGFRPAWFRPFPGNLDQLKRIVVQAKRHDLPVLNLMMHSNEFCHHTNPYFDTESKVDNLLNSLKSLFSFLRAENTEFLTPYEYYALAKNSSLREVEI